MDKPAPENPQLRRIDALGAAHDPPLTRYAVAKLADVDESTIRKYERKPEGRMNSRTISKIAAALGCRPEDLLTDDPPPLLLATPHHGRSQLDDLGDVPVRGAAAGAAAASFVLQSEPVDYVPRPPALRRVRAAYAVYIENDSMEPMHARGDLRFVDPNRPPRPGDSVIVQTLDPKGDRQAWIKILEKRVDGWIVCKQLNPPAEVRYNRENVVALHRVLTTADLFNR